MIESKPKVNLVALRDEREKTIQLLSDAFAADLFDVDEFESRVEQAQQANHCEGLISLRQDIEVDAASSEETAIGIATQKAQQALVAAQPKSGWAIGLFSASERKGQWRVPKVLKVVGCMGAVVVDLREAIIAPGITELKVTAFMGAVEIIVPPGLAFECNGIGLIGSFEGDDQAPAVPDLTKPLLRIQGLAFMGSSEVDVRQVGESGRQARKRRRREKKALEKDRKREQKALAKSRPKRLP